MKTLKNKLAFYLPTGILFFLCAFDSSNAENRMAKTTSAVVCIIPASSIELPPEEASTVKIALEKAQSAGKAVFVVVSGNGVTGVDKAVLIAEKAKAIYKNAVLVQMNRDDAANTQLVNEWRLSGAPLPLILVVSPKGILAGGQILAQATAESLAAFIPSPKKEEVLEQLVNGKSVFLLVSKKSMAKKSERLSTCQKACIEMQEKAKVVEIDLDDSKEIAFINELKINRNITEPAIYVVNSKGQITGTFNGDTNSAALTASARKVVSSGCCAPGSGQTCAPAK
jgi:hypothetical protein